VVLALEITDEAHAREAAATAGDALAPLACWGERASVIEVERLYHSNVFALLAVT